jgi:hypothetical protein
LYDDQLRKAQLLAGRQYHSSNQPPFSFSISKSCFAFVTKSKKAFSLMSSIAVHPEPAALPTHGLMSRRSTWLNYIQSYYFCK